MLCYNLEKIFKDGTNMKKILLNLLVILLGFVMIGCESINNPNPDNGDKPIKDPIKPDVNPDGEVLLKLSEFGDYVKSKSDLTADQLTKTYNDLRTVVNGEVNGIYQTKYEQGLLDLFNYLNKVKITINIAKEDLEIMTEYHNRRNEESYRPCSIDLELDDLIFHFEKVGIRQKGNTSRGSVMNGDGTMQLRHYKLSFSEIFDDEFRDDQVQMSEEEIAYIEERSLFGLEKLDIRFNRNQDGTYLKEFYSYEMYRANGVLAPRTNLATVGMNIDGNYQNAGVYLMVETIDKKFIKRNLLKDYTSGDLYKLGWTNVGATFDNLDSSLFGVEKQTVNSDEYSFSAQKYPYDLKTNKKTSDHSAIKTFIGKVINTSNTDFYNMLQEYSMYDEFITYLAISYLLGDPDDLRGNYNNTYVYFVPTTNGNKILFMPTDHDRALGSTGGSNPTGHFGTGNGPYSPRTGYSENWSPLFRKTIIDTGNSQIKSDYIKRIEEIIEKGWMKLNTFNVYFDVASTHYSQDITLGDLFNDSDVSFKIIENNNVNDNWNLSIEVYFREKIKTFNNKK